MLPTSALLLSQLSDSNEELQELLKEEGFVAVKQIVENHPVVSPPPHTGVVWCGVVWCAVVWCDVVWCGVLWLECGVVWWCGVVWCSVVWCTVAVHMFVCEHW